MERHWNEAGTFLSFHVSESIRTARLREKVLALLASWVIRLLGRTLRYEFQDAAGMLDRECRRQFIWSIWHNRVLIMPYVRNRFLRHREGAVLTSASRDGEILARVVHRFGIGAERGSSSRRGVQALLGMMRWLERGSDVCITPDGPRGPAYEPGPGILLLAEKSGAAIVPIGLEFSAYWRLRSWDRFFIPKPFCRCRVLFGAPVEISKGSDTSLGEAENRLRAAMKSVTETD